MLEPEASTDNGDETNDAWSTIADVRTKAMSGVSGEYGGGGDGMAAGNSLS